MFSKSAHFLKKSEKMPNFQLENAISRKCEGAAQNRGTGKFLGLVVPKNTREKGSHSLREHRKKPSWSFFEVSKWLPETSKNDQLGFFYVP